MLKLEIIQSITDIQKLNGHKIIISFQGGIKTLRNDILTKCDEVSSMVIRKKSLEDVFLKLTGRSLRN